MEGKWEDDHIKILIVDDLDINVSILENIIQAEGYEALCANNAKEALDIMKETMPHLILSDYYMPDMDGLEFCRLLKRNPKTSDIPFMFITVADSSEDKRNAFEAGAVDYIPKPFERVEVVMRVQNQLNSFQSKQKIEENNRMMHQVITEKQKSVEKEQENLLVALSIVLGRRNPVVEEYLECIGYNCKMFARSLQLSVQYEQIINDEYVDSLYNAAKLHDIGSLIMKENSLSGDEYLHHSHESLEYLEKHTGEGARLLNEINRRCTESHSLELAAEIAAYHHAHYDGSGYPSGIGADDIPLSARIFSVVNGFDFAVRRHADRRTVLEDASAWLKERSGTVYEPFMVEVFLKILKQIKTPF